MFAEILIKFLHDLQMNLISFYFILKIIFICIYLDLIWSLLIRFKLIHFQDFLKVFLKIINLQKVNSLPQYLCY